MIEPFLIELDGEWPQVRERVRLCVIGCGALMLRTDYRRGTKDGDILETVDLAAEDKARLITLAGRDTELHKRCKVYIDIVPNGLPFLPQVPVWHSVPQLDDRLGKLEIRVLDEVDVVVSKLKPFRPTDVADIDAMIKRGLSHEQVLARFNAAVDMFSCDARASELPRYVENLHQVERDMFGVNETKMDLPSWV